MAFPTHDDYRNYLAGGPEPRSPEPAQSVLTSGLPAPQAPPGGQPARTPPQPSATPSGDVYASPGGQPNQPQTQLATAPQTSRSAGPTRQVGPRAERPAATGTIWGQQYSQGQQIPGGAQAPAGAPPAPRPPLGPGPILAGEGTFGQRLVQGLQQGAQTEQQQTAAQATQQMSAVGEAPVYSEAPIEAYIQGTGPAEPARKLATEGYTGPTGLGDEFVATQAQDAAGLANRAAGLTSGYGLQAVINQASPGLTPGELRFEAQRLLDDPEYKQDAYLAAGSVPELARQAAAADQRVRELASARADEYAAVQKQAREFLTGKQTLLEEELEARAAEENLRNQQLQATYQQFLETGDLSLLADIQNLGFDISAFITPEVSQVLEEQALFDEIMDNPAYAPIAQWDPLQMGLTKEGRERYVVPYTPEEQELWEAGKNVPQKSLEKALKKGTIDQETYDLLLRRQAELDQAFGVEHSGTFRQYLERQLDPELAAEFGAMTAGEAPRWARQAHYAENVGALEGGEAENLSYLDPLTGELVTPDLPTPDLYTDFLEGTLAAPENISTDEERMIFNRTNELLENAERMLLEADRLAAGGEEYRAAQIFAEQNKFLEDVERAIEAQGEKRTEAQEEQLRRVRRARRSYRTASRAKTYGKVGAAIGATIGAATYPLHLGYAVPVTTEAGRSIGESLA